MTGMTFLQLFFLLQIIGSALGISPEFDDQLMYSISWNSPLEKAGEESIKENIVVVSKDNEKYQCALPDIFQGDKGAGDISDGPSPEVLLSDVLMGATQKCSFRLEPYWTYELCHGEKVVQFHEEKDGDGVVQRNEFFLGAMTKAEVTEVLSPAKPIVAPGESRQVPVRKINNKDTPYYSVEMPNGTPCDLNNGTPRKTTVLYICHPSANNEIMSVKEVRTCEYEAIVLTPVLCGNPAYIMKKKPVHDIQCHAFPGSPNRPSRLLQEAIQKGREVAMQEDNLQPKQPERSHFKPSVDQNINDRFLSGKFCLIGGSGWWQYEFCNGKHISQFHEEPNKPRTVVVVGRWNKEEHMKYITSKRIKAKGKKHVSHYYSGGDVCDLTGKPRTATVMLICKEGQGQQLSIYMIEKEPCVYTVGVESPILCPHVAKANKFGLFQMPSSPGGET